MMYEGKCPFFKVIDEFLSRYIPDDEMKKDDLTEDEVGDEFKELRVYDPEELLKKKTMDFKRM